MSSSLDNMVDELVDLQAQRRELEAKVADLKSQESQLSGFIVSHNEFSQSNFKLKYGERLTLQSKYADQTDRWSNLDRYQVAKADLKKLAQKSFISGDTEAAKKIVDQHGNLVQLSPKSGVDVETLVEVLNQYSQDIEVKLPGRIAHQGNPDLRPSYSFKAK